MATYAELQEQIAALQKEAETIRKTEIKDAIGQIKAKMAELGITPADLGFSGKDVEKQTKEKSIAPPKYRDPASDKTWNGRGVSPKWLVGDRAQYLISK